MCLNCGGLLVFASKHSGTPYVPAYHLISATLTGTFAPAPAAPVTPKQPTVRSVSQVVGMLRHLPVYDRRSTEAHGSSMLKDLWKNSSKFFKKKAHESRESFVELVRLNRHPLAHGFFCDGMSYELWLDNTWPDPLFTEKASADEHFLPFQPLAEITWLPIGAGGSIVDSDDIEHQLYFDVRCRHLARTFLELIEDFGPTPAFFMEGGELSPVHKRWMWKLLLGVASGRAENH